MADGGWRNDQGNETLLAIAKYLRNPLFADDSKEWSDKSGSKMSALSDTVSEALFGKAPQEIEKWAHGDFPMEIAQEGGKVPRFKPTYDEYSHEPGNRAMDFTNALTSLPVATAVKALKTAPAAVGLAGVVKPKGGNWLGAEGAKRALRPEPAPYGDDAQTYNAFDKFRESMNDAYQKRRDKWIMTDMGTEGDPLKDVPIGELPHTWGDFGDAAVHKLDPEHLKIGTREGVVYDPQTGNPMYNEKGTHLMEYLPTAEYSSTVSGVPSFYEENQPRLVESLRNFKKNPTEANQPYMSNEYSSIIRNLAKMKRETPRSQYIEGNPEWKGEESGIPKWLSGEKVVGPLPEWMAEADDSLRIGQIKENIARTMSEVGEYGGHYKQPNIANPKAPPRDFELAKDYREDFPTTIKEWPKQYDLKEKRNVERNMAGMEVDPDLPTAGGMRWAKVASPDALKRQAKLMRNCSGGYCDQLSEGTTEFHTLVDQYGAPNVMVANSVKRPKPIIEAGEPLHNIPRAVRDPHDYRVNWNGEAWPANMPRHPGVQDPDQMARILRAVEIVDNPDHYADFLERNPDVRAVVEQHPRNARDILQGLLPQEDWEHIRPLFEATGPVTKAIKEVKGRANQAVAPRDQEMLVQFLRGKSGEIQPGSLADSSEARFAQVVPVKDSSAPGGYTYHQKGEAQNILRKLLEEYRRIGPDNASAFSRKYGRGVTRAMEDMADSSDPEGVIQNFDITQLAKMFGK